MKNFLNISDLNLKELKKILNFAKKLKKNKNKYTSILKNKSLGLIFEKQSTRTRLSFVVGIQKLGGNAIELSENQIGYGVRESKKDIIKVMSQYLDAIIIRNDDHDQLTNLASMDVVPIINGLSNFSHPCQILSDIFTIEESIGNIRNKTITWMGDFNNVLISLIEAAEIFKFKLNICTPYNLIKNKKKLKYKKLKFCTFFKDINLGLKNSDCVMTDTWISMGEKNSMIKKNKLKKFQVNSEIMKQANKKAIFMHCLPAHREEEVTSRVLDGKQSIVWQQAKNRMYVQQSIMCYLLGYVKI